MVIIRMTDNTSDDPVLIGVLHLFWLSLCHGGSEEGTVAEIARTVLGRMAGNRSMFTDNGVHLVVINGIRVRSTHSSIDPPTTRYGA